MYKIISTGEEIKLEHDYLSVIIVNEDGTENQNPEKIQQARLEKANALIELGILAEIKLDSKQSKQIITE